MKQKKGKCTELALQIHIDIKYSNKTHESQRRCSVDNTWKMDIDHVNINQQEC